MKAKLKDWLLDLYCWYVATKIHILILFCMINELETNKDYLEYGTNSIYNNIIKITEWEN